MKWTEVGLSNMGPIEEGKIGSSMISVFLGPHNSGKSIASRIIYALGQLGENGLTAGAAERLLEAGRGRGAAMPPLAPALIAVNAGIDICDVATRGAAGGGRIDVAVKGGRTASFSFASAPDPSLISFARSAEGAGIAVSEDTVYVPAGRTCIARAPGSRPPQAGGGHGGGAGAAAGRAARLGGPSPEWASGRLGDGARDMLARLFGGSVEGGRGPGGGAPRLRYRDARGFAAEIESAGAGIASALPIAAGIHGIGRGGTLIVEEPEAHLDPLTQQRMAAELARAAASSGARLLFTTHSEYMVYPLLSMVSHGDLGRGDLGIYHFGGGPDSYTRIERMGVSEDGRIDRELFEEALDALGARP